MSIHPFIEPAQSPDRISQALALSPRFYEAAMEPARWPAVLDELRHTIGAGIAQLTVVKTADVRVLQTFWSGGTEEQRRAYLKYDKFAEDPRTPAIAQFPFRPVHCRQLITDDQWYQSDVYNELLKPFGYDHSLIYLVYNASGSMAAVLGMLRHENAGTFNDDDIGHLSLYAPHLRRAFEVTMRLIDDVAEHDIFTHVLDRVEAAIMVMDRFGHPRHINRAGRALLDEGRHLTDAQGPIRALDPAMTEPLMRDILEAGLAGLDGRDHPPVRRTLRGVGSTPPIHATVAALSEAGERTGGLVPDGAVVGLFITDPRRPFETDTEHMQRLFGLTATEALILRELLTHGSARKIAEATGRGYETVRTHIKTVREKLGAANQTELVRLVAQALHAAGQTPR